jgi:hypothetical protein
MTNDECDITIEEGVATELLSTFDQTINRTLQEHTAGSKHSRGKRSFFKSGSGAANSFLN